MIEGDTKLIAHIGHPTATFKAPLIYNPWFRRRGIDAAVVPLGVTSKNFGEAFPQICRFTNFRLSARNQHQERPARLPPVGPDVGRRLSGL
jgi:hypothetical protein